MKKILTTNLFALLTATMFGMSYQPVSPIQPKSANPGDSSETEGHICNHFEDIFPAESYYGQWDTDIVHYYGQHTIEQFANTRLVLAHNSNCDFFFPIPDGQITSKFGPRGRKGKMHKGIDIDLETGDPVYSAFEGKVRFAAFNESYGNCVVVRHPNGLETYYAHLDKLGVASGDYVQAGDYLGAGGNTGRSRGSHLHFEVRFLGVAIDPFSIIKEGEYKLALESLIINRKSEKIATIRIAEKYHLVQPGDDLQSIAEKYCVPVASIIELNSITESSMLLIDSKIRFQ